jgi:type II secretion system protein N
MAASVHGTGGELPAWFRTIVVPIAGVSLVLLFVLRGFPYDAVSDRIITALEPALGARLHITELGPTLGLSGPAMQATGVRASFPDAKTLNIDRLMVRPAFSTAWFEGGRAFYVELESASGAATGVFELGEISRFEGSIQNLDLTQLPLGAMLPSRAIEGRIDATLSLQIGEQGPEGPVSFEMHDGSLTIPNLPIALPFQKISGEIELGGDAFLNIESLALEGPIVTGTGSGTIARAPSFANAPLRLEFKLNVKPALAGGVRSAGLRIDRKGNTTVRITGTVAAPNLR